MAVPEGIKMTKGFSVPVIMTNAMIELLARDVTLKIFISKVYMFNYCITLTLLLSGRLHL